mmetsp:Transcript_33065/g.61663  ORF Transcript_33065/g.61663 Transcript_33065/m.61663 type:complete len:328 (+) Transcript_33065:46-1029(+)
MAANAPPVEAVRQDDGSYMLTNEDGSVSRWTRRPDGTWRKPERRKAGFVGELEQKKYVSPGVQTERTMQEATAKVRGQIPGLPPGAGYPDDAAEKAKVNKRNERKKEQRREKAEEKDKQRVAELSGAAADEGVVEDAAPAKPAEEAPTSWEEGAQESSATKDQKTLKGLEKKLRQITDLENKQASGDALNSDQLAKIQGKALLEAQIQSLIAQLNGTGQASAESLDAPNEPGSQELCAPAVLTASVATASTADESAHTEDAPAVEPQAAEVSSGGAQLSSSKRKNLEKKLRQIAELEEKQSRGETLNADQLAKLASKAELESALQAC